MHAHEMSEAQIALLALEFLPTYLKHGKDSGVDKARIITEFAAERGVCVCAVMAAILFIGEQVQAGLVATDLFGEGGIANA